MGGGALRLPLSMAVLSGLAGRLESRLANNYLGWRGPRSLEGAASAQRRSCLGRSARRGGWREGWEWGALHDAIVHNDSWRPITTQKVANQKAAWLGSDCTLRFRPNQGGAPGPISLKPKTKERRGEGDEGE
eukprot:scaffold37464_cov31-Tisochrysis_lutea.AAC.3